MATHHSSDSEVNECSCSKDELLEILNRANDKIDSNKESRKRIERKLDELHEEFDEITIERDCGEIGF